MILSLQEIPDGRSEITRTASFDPEQAADTGITTPVACTATIDRMGPVLVLRVAYTGSAAYECSRCLSSYTAQIEGNFDTTAAGERVADDDTEFRFRDSEIQLNITPALYDDVILNQPIMPLCPGGCTTEALADNDSQKTDAASQESLVDPRWQALAKLRK